MITYFLLCGYTPFDRDSNLEEMQAILVADYSFTPLEYWRHVSKSARQFIQRCLTIDPMERMSSQEALAHPWITGESEAKPGEPGKVDLLPTVKKNFNARRTLHAAIDTIRAINQLRAGGAAAMNAPAPQRPTGPPASHEPNRPGSGAMEGVEPTGKSHVAEQAGLMPDKENVTQGVGQLEIDPRGHGRGQTEEMIREQQRRIHETSKGLWERAHLHR